MRTFLLLSFSFFLLHTAFAQQYVINAHVTGFPNGTKFYLHDINVDANIDSAIIKNDRLVMKGKLAATPQSLWFCASIADKGFYYTNLFISNDKIFIEGDIKDMPFDLKITGSKTQDDHNQLNVLTKEGYKERNKLVKDYFALKGDSAAIKSKQIWKVIGKIDSTDDALRMNYVRTHLNSYTALNELFYLKNNFERDTLAYFYNKLQPGFKQSPYGQRIGTYLKVGKILKKGDTMADFEAQDKQGNKHKLSDIKGKYILLDFSTTYCGPCIQSLEDLKLLEKKYAGKLQIITFSGDGGKDTWLQGIKRDAPTWLSLWDGKGNYGETILKYGVTGYPTFVIIDPNGKILNNWSGFGKEDDGKGSLETKVDKVLSKL